MAWKVKKEYEGKTVPNCNTPLNDLTQKEINKLGESVRNAYFIKEQPKKKKHDTTIKRS